MCTPLVRAGNTSVSEGRERGEETHHEGCFAVVLRYLGRDLADPARRPSAQVQREGEREEPTIASDR